MNRAIRMTPAMAANVTDHLWELPELCDALLTEPAGEKPVKVRLAHREPEATHRELPGGRGFLRVVGGSKSAPDAAPMPEAPTPAPVAPVVQADAAMAVDDSQLDLLSWKPRARGPLQGNLFGAPDELT